MQLAGKRALVTGGGRGIGRAVVLALAREGADVAVSYVSGAAGAESAAAAVRDLGRRAVTFQGDAGSRAEVERVVAGTIDALGGVDLLVANAGMLTRRPFLELPETEFDRVVAVDLKGPFLIGQAVARHMVERGGGGCIVNVSSISDSRAFPGLSHYQAAKAGLTMLTRGMALELAPHGIRVNAVNPGLIATDINRGQRETQPEVWQARAARIPLGRAGAPEDITGAVVFLCSDAAGWITGTTLVVDGGQTTM